MSMPRLSSLCVTSVLALTAACGGDGLGREDVENLPAGSAVGSAASGTYALELVTRECRGRCPVIDGGWFEVSVCDVGEVDDAELVVTQTDGALEIAADGLVLERLEGGIDDDGGFTVGAWGTEHGGDMTIAIRSDGTFAGGRITGSAESHGQGEIEDTRVDCTAIYELSGQRTDATP